MVRFTIQLESFDLDEFLVAFVVPGIVSEEPRCMHVKTPGSPKRDGGNKSEKMKIKRSYLLPSTSSPSKSKSPS